MNIYMHVSRCCWRVEYYHAQDTRFNVPYYRLDDCLALNCSVNQSNIATILVSVTRHSVSIDHITVTRRTVFAKVLQMEDHGQILGSPTMFFKCVDPACTPQVTF